jgi:sugar phosphate isomerase/epimerase
MAPNSFSLGTPAQFHDLFESFPEFKLTLDVGHANLGPGGFNRTITFIKQFEDKIGHIHMSDNFGKQDNHLPIGAGIIDYPNILKALSATSFNGAITLEVFSKDKEFLLLSRKKIHGMWRDNKKE